MTRRLAVLLLAGAAALPVAGGAGSARPAGPAAAITMADILLLKTPASPRVSPDGRWVAFTVSVADTATSRVPIDIQIVPADGAVPPRVLVRGLDKEASLRWSPDGRWLAYTAPGSDSATGPNQIWLVSLPEGARTRLTAAPEGIDSYAWAPDGASLIYLTTSAWPPAEKARREADRKRKMDAIVEGEPRRPKEFLRQPAAGGAARHLFTGDPGIHDWDLSPDGASIVFSSNGTGLENDEPLFDLWRVDIGSERLARLTTRYGPDTSPLFSPDGNWIAFKADQDTTVTFSEEEIFVVPAGGGGPRCLTAEADVSINSFIWRPDGKGLWADVPLGADNGLVETPLAAGVIRRLDDIPAGGDAPSFSSEPSLSRDGRAMAWIGEGPDSWPDVWIRRDDGRPRQLTRLNPDLDTSGWPKLEQIGYGSRDGRTLFGLIMKPPPAVASPPYPTIAYPHGGPFNRATNRLRGGPTSLVLASHGYLVFDPNYRGSRGYGQEYGQASRGDLGGVDLRDILDGFDWLIRNGLADSTRLGIGGGSYGGYLAIQAIATTQRFKAAVSLYGFSNFFTGCLNSGEPSWEMEYFGGDPWRKESLYHDRSPLFRAPDIRTPLLLLHGDEDAVVSLASSREIWTALRILNRTVEFVHYPREKHGFREPSHRIDAARRTLEWFDRYLGMKRP